MPDHIYDRDGTWYFQAVVGRRLHRRSLRTGDRNLAKKRAAQLYARLVAESWGERRYTWKEAVVAWDREVAPSMAPNAALRYRVSFRACRHLLENLHLDEIDNRLLRRVASRPGVSNATRKRDLTAISGVLRAAYLWGWTEGNAAKLFDRSLLRERREPITLPQPEEIDRLCALLPGNLAHLVRFLRATGMRLEEAVGLTWDRVDLKRRVAQLVHTKAGKPRAVPLNEPAVITLSNTVRHLKCPYVFWCARGDGAGPYRNASGRLRGYRREAKVAWRTHDLRHLFAVEFLRAGGNIHVLQQIMGHSTLIVTELYLHWLTPDEVLVAKGLIAAP